MDKCDILNIISGIVGVIFGGTAGSLITLRVTKTKKKGNMGNVTISGNSTGGGSIAGRDNK